MHESPSEIPHLVWDEKVQVYVKSVSAKATLTGHYPKTPDDLVAIQGSDTENTQLLLSSSKGGSFKYEVELTGQRTPITVMLIKINGEQLRDTFFIEFPDWSKINQEQASPTEESSSWKFNFLSTQLYAVYLKNFTGQDLSPMVNWTPTYQNHQFLVQLNLGVMPIRSTVGNFVFEYAVQAGVHIYKNMWMKILGGAQYWTDFHNHGPTLGVLSTYTLPKYYLGFVDSISLGYTGTIFPQNYTSEVRLGIGMSF